MNLTSMMNCLKLLLHLLVSEVQMTEKETKEVILVAFSSYATHKKYTSEEWLRAQEAKRKHPEISKRYKALLRK